MSSFPEIAIAKKEGRHELVLSGKEIEERIKKNEGKLPQELFQLELLNFLEISRAGLAILPPQIGSLKGLTRLNLRENQLTELPSEISSLEKLKYLDLSFNALTSLPDTISDLRHLQVLNLNQNKLSSIPSLANSPTLIELIVSGNQLEAVPDFMLDSEKMSAFIYFATLTLDGNAISEIPSELATLPGLKALNLERNKIVLVPGELADAPKIKEIKLDGNPLKDKRLAKQIKDGHSKPGKVIEYIRANCPKSGAGGEGATGGKGKGKKGKKKGGNAAPTGDVAQNRDTVIVKPSDEAFKIVLESKVNEVRPHLICCIVKNVSLDFKLKSFLVMQNKFHDDDKICAKRTAATIATHDLALVKAPLRYTALAPDTLKILPLKGNKVQSGTELVAKLMEEAEALRKKEKKSTFSGIHKYLYLVKPLKEYACLIDSEENAISFPPITNSDITKMTEDTTDLLIEISSSADQKTCKKIMNLLLLEMLKSGYGATEESSDNLGEGSKLTIQQVKILNEAGEVHATYPDKNDLDLPEIEVIREK